MILVTGASGFLGGELVKQLVANGESVRIIKRKNSSLSYLQSIIHKIDVVEADILDVPSLEIAFDGIEKIYHSAAVIGYDSSYYDAMYKTNIEGTANVVNVALTKKVKKILHVSSIAAIGGKPNELIDENTKWEKNEWTTHYGITKMLAEREIYRGIAEGLEAVIVNPGIIIGVGNDEHKSLIQLFKRIATNKMPFYTNGTNGFVDVEDVAKASILLMNSNVNNERFILINENVSFKNYFEKIASSVHVKPPKKALSKTSGNLFVFLDWLSSKLSGKKRGLTQENLKVSLENFKYSNYKIKQQLNFEFIPIDETIQKVANQLNK
ncbi:MAG: NAD-dependent epimerase/dehydratase family protein [Chitinophagales bacterium]